MRRAIGARLAGREVVTQIGTTYFRRATSDGAGRRVRRAPLAVGDVAEPEARVKYEGRPLVLLRPDQHVAWHGYESELNAATIVATLSGARE